MNNTDDFSSLGNTLTRCPTDFEGNEDAHLARSEHFQACTEARQVNVRVEAR
ncbi:hypothetical protein [Allokutzneria oryzae]|uniref:Uncharacterized protein n=1 Tax=Allokutzneria oryzae TaxID=1378989 RepID=A0ABV5ZZY3_9PSEU